MIEEYKAQIWDVLSKFSLLFDNPPPNARLEAYCAYLAKYSPKQIKLVLDSMAREFEKFPSLAAIMKILEPKIIEKDRANELVGELFSAVKKFGYYRAVEAKEFLAAKKWKCVENFGGWENLCLVERDEMAMARAQLRDICMSVGAYEKITAAKKLELPDSPPNILKLKTIL